MLRRHLEEGGVDVLTKRNPKQGGRLFVRYYPQPCRECRLFLRLRGTSVTGGEERGVKNVMRRDADHHGGY